MAMTGLTVSAGTSPVTSCLEMSGNAKRNGKAPAVVVFDFDQTIATTHVWQLLRGKNDPKLLAAVADATLWGSEARLAGLRAMWQTLREHDVGIHMVSHNWAPIVEAALIRAELKPDSVHGRETVRRKGRAVNQLLAATNVRPGDAYFVDDDIANVKDVTRDNPGIRTMVSPPTGLRAEHMEKLKTWAAA